MNLELPHIFMEKTRFQIGKYSHFVQRVTCSANVDCGFGYMQGYDSAFRHGLLLNHLLYLCESVIFNQLSGLVVKTIFHRGDGNTGWMIPALRSYECNLVASMLQVSYLALRLSLETWDWFEEEIACNYYVNKALNWFIFNFVSYRQCWGRGVEINHAMPKWLVCQHTAVCYMPLIGW